jgi:negative regulator of flagellin synthesis FlgM
MPPIEFGPKGPQAPRAVGAVDHRKVPAKPVGGDRAAEVANARSAVVRSRMVEAGEPPVDGARVAEIARAIEQDRYPVLPMKVADAMIAAGLLLRSGK